MRIQKHPILDFDRGREVEFIFNGRKLRAYSNETVAAALLANGINVFSKSVKLGRERGFFCGIGRCCSCDMVINGTPNVRACVTLVAEGMDVRTQEGKGDFSAAE